MPTITTRAGKGSELSHAELDANFTKPVSQQTTTYLTVIADNRTVIEGNHASTPFTISLGVATDMDADDVGDYEVTIVNIGAAVVTIARSGSDTINGAATSLTLNQWQSVMLKVNSAGTGYITVARDLNVVDDDIDAAADIDASKLLAASVTVTQMAADAITRAKIDTSTANLSGSVSALTNTTIVLDAYSFFPMIHTASPGVRLLLSGAVSDAADPDLPRFGIYNIHPTLQAAYDVDYRYIVA